MNAHMQGHAPLPHEHEQVLHLLEVPFEELQPPVRLPVVLAVPAELVAGCGGCLGGGVNGWVIVAEGVCGGFGVGEWVDRPYLFWCVYGYEWWSKKRNRSMPRTHARTYRSFSRGRKTRWGLVSLMEVIGQKRRSKGFLNRCRLAAQ